MDSYVEQNYFIKIDPYREMIEPTSFSDSYSQLAWQLGARHLGVYAEQPSLDAALMNAQALTTDLLPPAWRYRPTGELYFGPAIWVNISESGQLRVPLKRVDQLLEEIDFLGFVEICTEYIPFGEPQSDNESEAGDDTWPDMEF